MPDASLVNPLLGSKWRRFVLRCGAVYLCERLFLLRDELPRQAAFAACVLAHLTGTTDIPSRAEEQRIGQS